MGGRRDDDQNLAVLAHRVRALEHRMRDGFEHIDARLDALHFVPRELYDAHRLSLEDVLREMRHEIGANKAEAEKRDEKNREDAAKQAKEAASAGRWALGLIGGTFLLVLIGIIVRVALDLAGAPV